MMLLYMRRAPFLYVWAIHVVATLDYTCLIVVKMNRITRKISRDSFAFPNRNASSSNLEK